MWRTLNMVLALMIGLTVYKTYDIKHDVMELQRQIVQIKQTIVAENNSIGMYEAEWATLNSAFNLNRLKKKLLPDHRSLSYRDIHSIEEIPFRSQISSSQDNLSVLHQELIESGAASDSIAIQN